MKKLLVAVGVVGLVAGCTPGQQGTNSTPPPVAPLIVAVRTSNPPTQAWAGNPDTVELISLGGRVIAQETFEARKVPYIGNAGVPLQPVAQVVGENVYYIDGYGVVHRLKVGSAPQVVATFAQAPGQFETWFAVSGDGRQVIAGVLTYPAIGPAPDGVPWPSLVGPWKFDLELSTSGASPVTIKHSESADRPDTQSSSWKPIFPVGWSSQGAIAMVPMSVGTQNAWYGGRLFVLDASGNQITQLGGPDCTSASVNVSGAIACVSSSANTVSVRDIKGNVMWSPTVQGVNALQVALSPNGNGITDGQLVQTRQGTVRMPSGFTVQGWLDDDTVVGRVADPATNNQGNLAWISLGSPATVHDLGLAADYVAALYSAS